MHFTASRLQLLDGRRRQHVDIEGTGYDVSGCVHRYEIEDCFFLSYSHTSFDPAVFLINVVRVLCNKLHPGTAQLAPLALQKALRATMILVSKPALSLSFGSAATDLCWVLRERRYRCSDCTSCCCRSGRTPAVRSTKRTRSRRRCSSACR